MKSLETAFGLPNGLRPEKLTAPTEAALPDEKTLGQEEFYIAPESINFTYNIPPVLESEKSEAFFSDPVEQYLYEIGQFPLLSIDQEIEVGKKIASPVEEVRQEGINEMIRHNLRLVIPIASYYVENRESLNMLDLIQEGNLGLIRAAALFDYTKGFKFSTYATTWIKSTITYGIDRLDKTIKLPRNTSSKIKRFYNTGARLAQKLGRFPTEEELADENDMTLEELRAFKTIPTFTVDLNQKVVVESESSELQDFIEDDSGIGRNPADVILEKDTKERLSELLGSFKEREGRILELRFGLNGEREHTLKEVAKIIGITYQRVNQIEKKYLKKLGEGKRGKLLRELFLEV